MKRLIVGVSCLLSLCLVACGPTSPPQVDQNGQPVAQPQSSWMPMALSGLAGYMLGRSSGGVQQQPVAATPVVVNRTVVNKTIIVQHPPQPQPAQAATPPKTATAQPATPTVTRSTPPSPPKSNFSVSRSSSSSGSRSFSGGRR